MIEYRKFARKRKNISKKTENYTNIICTLIIVVPLMLITIKSSRILEILLVSGIGAKVGEKIISYTKDYLKKQKVSKHEKSEQKDF